MIAEVLLGIMVAQMIYVALKLEKINAEIGTVIELMRR
jgi:hypothetical protein